jgi:hypothetical protein
MTRTPQKARELARRILQRPARQYFETGDFKNVRDFFDSLRTAHHPRVWWLQRARGPEPLSHEAVLWAVRKIARALQDTLHGKPYTGYWLVTSCSDRIHEEPLFCFWTGREIPALLTIYVNTCTSKEGRLCLPSLETHDLSKSNKCQ